MQFRDLRVGLLGGSFDPAHEGHVHITKEALRRFDLDQVWWLVSPGNPLKSHAPAPIEARIAQAKSVMVHPRVKISDLERKLGTVYTADTLRGLIAKFPRTKFIWLMGADSMAGLDNWQDWRWIMETVPVGVLARPGQRISARMSKAARIYSSFRLRRAQSRLLSHSVAPAWCFVNVPMSDASSTKIRAAKTKL